MVFFDKLFASNRRTLLFVLAGALLNLIVFASLFGFHQNNDTEGYIFSIQFFRGQDMPMFPNRYLNPLYPFVAGNILFFLPPVQALVVLNIIFYFGLVLLTYGLIRRAWSSKVVAAFSTLIIVSGYPMLRYALTQVQDIGGYFWYVATLYAGWRWYEERNRLWLVLVSVAVAFGALTKESGCMGALFVAVLLLARWRGLKDFIYNGIACTVLPLITLYINAKRGHDVGYSSARWFIDNWHMYAAENYHFIKWFGVNVSTFNIVWIFALLGAYWFVRTWLVSTGNAESKNIRAYLGAALISSLSYFAWPLFISRTVYISAWLIVPLAAYALNIIYNMRPYGAKLAIGGLLLLCVTPYVLQSTLRYAHVFQIYDICEHKLTCSWNYFWEHRSSFSTER